MEIIQLSKSTSEKTVDLFEKYRLSHGALDPDMLIASTALTLEIPLLSKKGHESEFQIFKDSISHEDLNETIKEVFASTSVPDTFRDSTLSRLKQRSLTISRKKLIFNYKLSFESLRS